jgi:multiple sugar transport system ATP-binding protein
MLAYRPKVFLMDEPLSNLDARLRMDMRAELKHLHHAAAATTIYVTHDQVEALTMSSCVAVMKDGVLQQLDTPERVYRFPANLFVADFIGNPKINLLRGTLRGPGCVDVRDFQLQINTQDVTTTEVAVAIRPEDISISTLPDPSAVEFTAYSVLPAGADSTVIARRGETEITVKEIGISKIAMDDRIWLKFHPDSINLFDQETGNLIAHRAQPEAIR